MESFSENKELLESKEKYTQDLKVSENFFNSFFEEEDYLQNINTGTRT